MTASNITHRAKILADGVNALFGAAPNKARLKLNEAVDLLAQCDGHRNRHAAIAATSHHVSDTAPRNDMTAADQPRRQTADMPCIPEGLASKMRGLYEAYAVLDRNSDATAQARGELATAFVRAAIDFIGADAIQISHHEALDHVSVHASFKGTKTSSTMKFRIRPGIEWPSGHRQGSSIKAKVQPRVEWPSGHPTAATSRNDHGRVATTPMSRLMNDYRTRYNRSMLSWTAGRSEASGGYTNDIIDARPESYEYQATMPTHLVRTSGDREDGIMACIEIYACEGNVDAAGILKWICGSHKEPFK